MAQLVAAVGRYGLTHEIATPPFQALARAIVYQQLNGIAARTIFTRFVALFGGADFPTPDAVLAMPDAALRGAGCSTAKTAAIKDLAAKCAAGTVPALDELLTLADDEIVERLTTVRGIGRWTVEMMLMFQLGRTDVWPVDDFGVRMGFKLAYGLRGMPTPKALYAFGERFRPHRSAAAWYLWRAVDLAKAGSLPAPPVRVRIAQAKKKKKSPVKRLRPHRGKPARRKARIRTGRATARK